MVSALMVTDVALFTKYPLSLLPFHPHVVLQIKEPEEKEKEKQTQQDKIADDDKEEKEEKVDVSLFSVPLFP